MGRFFLNIFFLFYISSLSGFAVLQDTNSVRESGKEAKHANPVELLSRMYDALQVDSLVDLSFELAVTDVDGTVTGSFDGVVYAQGYSFKLINPQLEVYCDSENKWILNLDNEELTIVPNDTSQVDIVENPVGFLLSLGRGNDQFKYPARAFDTRKPDNGESLWSIELEPVNEYMPYKLVTLCLDKETSLPSVIMYKGRDDSAFTIYVKSIKRSEPRPDSFFAFPAERAAGFTITDLR